VAEGGPVGAAVVARQCALFRGVVPVLGSPSCKGEMAVDGSMTEWALDVVRLSFPPGTYRSSIQKADVSRTSLIFSIQLDPAISNFIASLRLLFFVLPCIQRAVFGHLLACITLVIVREIIG
jgi:hypothetical protein